MRGIPSVLMARSEAVLRETSVPISDQSRYKQWQQYFLDFCEKYHVSESQ